MSMFNTFPTPRFMKSALCRKSRSKKQPQHHDIHSLYQIRISPGAMRCNACHSFNQPSHARAPRLLLPA
jgi:hypothetical protein